MTDINNPYSAPSAPLLQPATTEELATRGSRLAAAIIDGIIALAILAPAMVMTGYWARAQAAAMSGQTLMLEPLLWGVLGFVVMVGIQAKPLMATSQTWGKRIMKIQIVGLDGKPAPFATIVVKRMLPLQVMGVIPNAGGFLVLISVLLIFGKERRCAHDYIAGTKVIRFPGT